MSSLSTLFANPSTTQNGATTQSAPTTNNTQNTEFNNVFRTLSDNVKRLQNQLKETQSTMQNICQRAHALKNRVSTDASPARTPSSTPLSPSNSFDASALSPRTPIATSKHHSLPQTPVPASQTEEHPIAETTITEPAAAAPPKREPSTTASEAPTPTASISTSTDDSLQDERLFLLYQFEEQNRQLSQTLSEYEAAVQMIVTKTHSNMLDQRAAREREKQVLTSTIERATIDNEELRRENVVLKEKIQEMAQVMRNAAQLRDQEIQETEAFSVQLLKENSMLRTLLGLPDHVGMAMRQSAEAASENVITG